MLKLLWRSVENHFRYILILILTLGCYFSIVFYKIISLRPEGVYAGHVNVWSDWSLHIAIANIFAFKDFRYWFSYHPLYAGGKFTYPFLTDFISGMFMRIGVPLKQAFVFPSIVLVFVLLIGLYFLFYLLTESKKLSVVSVFIFFLSAGLGFIGYLKDLFNNPSFSYLVYPLKEIGRYDIYQWYASNMVVGLLVPQRAFLMGTALGVWAIVGVLYVILKDNELSKNVKIKILTVAGILAGILPIAHAHSFIAVVTIIGFLCLFNYKKREILWWYVLVAGIISSIIFLTFIWGGIENGSFASWHPGYTASGNLFNWLGMWTLLWGITLPMAVYGMFFYRRDIGRSKWAVYIAGFTLFTIGNLFFIQPIAWDNSKIFWWAYIIFSAPVSLVLGRIWSGRNFLFKLIVVVLFIVLTFTGFIELTRLVQTGKHEFMMTSTDDIKLGLEIREKTDPLAIFLTAPSHNHFVMVWGLRPILLGYTAWVWNFGFDYNSRELDMKKMFLGEPETNSLIKKYKISYVVIGPTEIHDLNANENYFNSNFNVAFKNNNYRIYDTKVVW